MTVMTIMINCLVLDKEGIDWAVNRLQYNLPVGPSWMREEHLWHCMEEARKSEEVAVTETGIHIGAATETAVEMTETEPQELSNCRKVVEITQMDLWGVHLAEEATWKEVVLIPKGGGD